VQKKGVRRMSGPAGNERTPLHVTVRVTSRFKVITALLFDHGVVGRSRRHGEMLINRRPILSSVCNNWKHNVSFRCFSSALFTGPKSQKFRASHWLDPRYGLYDSHIPTSTIQKVLIAASATISALRDPERGDQVAALGDTTVLNCRMPSYRIEMTGRHFVHPSGLLRSDPYAGSYAG
jgi:hypothetical protein